MSIAYVSVVEVEEFVMVILGFVLSSIVDKDGEKAKHCIVLFTSFSFLFFLYKKKSLGESSSKLTKVQTSSSKNTYNIIYILPTNKCHSRNQNSRSLGNCVPFLSSGPSFPSFSTHTTILSRPTIE